MMKHVLKTVLGLPFSLRQKRIARTRIPMTDSEFVHQIVKQGGDRDAASAVWRKLKEWGYEDGFTPQPADSLSSVFGIAEEELDEDLVLDILKELNVSVPNREVVGAFGVIDTPLQVAKFVAHCRRVASK